MLFLSLTGRAHQFEHVPTSDAKVQTQSDAHLYGLHSSLAVALVFAGVVRTLATVPVLAFPFLRQ